MAHNEIPNDSIEFRIALERFRSEYGEDFADRVEVSGALGRFVRDRDLNPGSSLTSEAVLQPILRYQQIPADDVRNQIERKVGEATAHEIIRTLRAFATAELDATE